MREVPRGFRPPPGEPQRQVSVAFFCNGTVLGRVVRPARFGTRLLCVTSHTQSRRWPNLIGRLAAEDGAP